MDGWADSSVLSKRRGISKTARADVCVGALVVAGVDIRNGSVLRPAILSKPLVKLVLSTTPKLSPNLALFMRYFVLFRCCSTSDLGSCFNRLAGNHDQIGTIQYIVLRKNVSFRAFRA